jgi:hypothetical protein
MSETRATRSETRTYGFENRPGPGRLSDPREVHPPHIRGCSGKCFREEVVEVLNAYPTFPLVKALRSDLSNHAKRDTKSQEHSPGTSIGTFWPYSTSDGELISSRTTGALGMAPTSQHWSAGPNTSRP